MWPRGQPEGATNSKICKNIYIRRNPLPGAGFGPVRCVKNDGDSLLPYERNGVSKTAIFRLAKPKLELNVHGI